MAQKGASTTPARVLASRRARAGRALAWPRISDALATAERAPPGGADIVVTYDLELTGEWQRDRLSARARVS